MEILALTQISPDEVVLACWGILVLNATLVYTWVVMAVLASGALLLTRGLAVEGAIGRRQRAVEAVVGSLQEAVREMAGDPAERYLPFIGTLFLFIATANVLAIVPGFVPPTASLSTTGALALLVFLAVPVYGIRAQGFRAYAREYVRPNIFFVPLHLVGQTARTVALTVRLFGNIMSHEKILGILLAVAPLFVPVVMQLLGLVIGIIQAYIFAVLAMVYIAAAASGSAEEGEGAGDSGPAPGTG